MIEKWSSVLRRCFHLVLRVLQNCSSQLSSRLRPQVGLNVLLGFRAQLSPKRQTREKFAPLFLRSREHLALTTSALKETTPLRSLAYSHTHHNFPLQRGPDLMEPAAFIVTPFCKRRFAWFWPILHSPSTPSYRWHRCDIVDLAASPLRIK